VKKKPTVWHGERVQGHDQHDRHDLRYVGFWVTGGKPEGFHEGELMEQDSRKAKRSKLGSAPTSVGTQYKHQKRRKKKTEKGKLVESEDPNTDVKKRGALETVKAPS